MAKIQYSAVVGDARNKAGGVVFTKGRFGAVARRKVSPVQPRSNDQMAVRSSLTSLSKAWSGAALDDTKRAAWRAFAAANPVKDVFGNTVTLTGHQMFVRLNRNLDTFSLPRIYTPPTSLACGGPVSLSVTAEAGTPDVLTITAGTNPAGSEGALVEAAAQQSPGRTFIGSRYRVIMATLTASPWDAKAAYTAKFGALVAGKKIPIRVSYITQATGAAGIPVTALQVVS